MLTAGSLTELASVRPPCLSLYQPTHRRHPENQQDPIRFRNLVKELEASLRQKYPAVETRLLLEPFEALDDLLDDLGELAGKMEARLEGLQPVAVTHQAATLDEAVEGAAGKLIRMIESTLGRLRDEKSRRTDPPPPGAIPHS